MLSGLGNILAGRNSTIRWLPLAVDPGHCQEILKQREFFVFESKERFLQTYCISSEPEALSAVDFDKSYVVGIHQGLCPTGGYRIHVQDVRVSKGIVEITVDFQEPAPDEIVTLAMTTPTAFFTVPRQAGEHKPPVFRFRTAGGTVLAERVPKFGKQEGV
ncbi:MAG: protease complex subunit PrcB family protein [Bacillota bacterium]|nr:protease complex subunit PrcB family protein [Candidatus Fermentithermobacillaceae bacterium]